MSDRDEFFVVWNPEHGLPRFRHALRRDAEEEAKRLAKANPGATFITMRAEKGFTVNDPVQVVNFVDDIPF